MSKILNITNGDCAVDIMKQAGISGDFLPWRDVLHDGPVISNFPLEALSELRAKFISNRGWGEFDIIKKDFVDRNNKLKSYQDYDKVILWFEHDLYDQLQIIQILGWFYHNGSDGDVLSMICTENYLGMISPDEVKNLMQYELPVTREQLALASKVWQAFGSPDAEDWVSLLDDDTTALPFLAAAILRQLEEYPDCTTGLSRTAFHALKIFSQGGNRCGKVFASYIETEERRFLGDSSFWIILEEMAQAKPPLISPKDGSVWKCSIKSTDEFIITKTGEDVLEGRASLLDYYDINRWIGGTNLNKDYLWCWDSVNKRLLMKQ